MQGEMSERRRTVEARLLDKAWKDAAFRRALVEDPTGTLERELGRTVPAEVTLTVLEETPTNRYLVLPAAPPQQGELSDQDLETLSGGGTEGTCMTWGVCVVPTSFICPFS
jgi:hypothetical protein